MTNEFENNEMRGRNLLAELFKQAGIEYMFTEDVYDRIDGYFQKDNKKASVEIKGRNKQYESFDTHLMECSKYDAMIKDMEDKNLNSAFYACFFGDDTLYMYNIKKIKDNSTVERRRCPRCTSANAGWCWKDCYMIDKSIATIFRKANDKWIKQEN